MKNFLGKKLNIKYSRNNRKIVGPLELDFYFPDINFAVEVNGAFHCKPIKGMDTLKKQKKRDSRKRKKCKELSILLRTVKPGNCKYETFMPRYKRVTWETNMFITCEEDSCRVVYDLSDSVRYVAKNGILQSAEKIVDKNIVSNLNLKEMSMRMNSDLFYVGRWLAR